MDIFKDGLTPSSSSHSLIKPDASVDCDAEERIRGSDAQKMLKGAIHQSPFHVLAVSDKTLVLPRRQLSL